MSRRMAGRRKRLQFGTMEEMGPQLRLRRAPGFLRNHVCVEFEESGGRKYGRSTALSLGSSLFSGLCFLLEKFLVVLTAATMHK